MPNGIATFRCLLLVLLLGLGLEAEAARHGMATESVAGAQVLPAMRAAGRPEHLRGRFHIDEMKQRSGQRGGRLTDAERVDPPSTQVLCDAVPQQRPARVGGAASRHRITAPLPQPLRRSHRFPPGHAPPAQRV